MITKKNQAVTYTAESASGSYKLIAEIKANRDETELITLNGIIRDNSDDTYIGSFSMIESSQSVNINNREGAVLQEVSAAIATFIEELIPAN